MAKVSFTCSMSGFDLLQIPEVYESRQLQCAVVCSASFYSLSCCSFSVPEVITLFLMVLHKTSAQIYF